MRLHADGVLDIDAPIGTYLPDYRAHPEHGHPTTRELLSHTAGLGNPLPVRWVRPADQSPDPALLARIITKHGTPKHAVGARASYSNIGYLLAGEVIASATGVTIEDCVRDRVLDPLGMEKTGYDYHPDAPRAVGYVRTPRVAVPLLQRPVARRDRGPRVQGHTALNPFLVKAPPTAASSAPPPTRSDSQPPTPPTRQTRTPCSATTTSMRCAPSPRPGSGSTTASAGSASRPMPHAPRRSSSTTAPAAATGTRCASTPHQRLAMVAMTNTTVRLGLRPALHPPQGPVMDMTTFDIERARRDTPGDRQRRTPQQRRRRTAPDPGHRRRRRPPAPRGRDRRVRGRRRGPRAGRTHLRRHRPAHRLPTLRESRSWRTPPAPGTWPSTGSPSRPATGS